MSKNLLHKSIITAFVLVFSIVPTFAASGDVEVLGTVLNCEEKLPFVQVKATCGPQNLSGSTGSTNGDFGKYSITFNNRDCTTGSIAEVTAKVGDQKFTATGTVGTYFFFLKKAWIDIQTGTDCPSPSVPEFGALTGVLAGLGSVGSYFVLKKRAIKA